MRKHKNRTISVLVNLALILLLSACSSTGRISRHNLAYLYQEEATFSGLPALVYHADDSVSLAIMEIDLGDMRYVSIANSELKACAYRLRFRLMDGYDTKLVLDSGSVVSGDTLNFGRGIRVLQSFELKTGGLEKSVLELELTDLNRRETVRRFFSVDRSSPYTRQNFMMVDQENYPVFRDYIAKDEMVRIVCNDPDIPVLHVRSYHREFPMARPPFGEDRQEQFDYKADSVYRVQVINGKTGLFSLDKVGFYHFQPDTTVKEGFTLFRFYDGFPEIRTTAQLVEPLRYITTKAEFEKVTAAEDQKEAVDQFWLGTAGNAARAKTLIQKYYGNVEEANRYFTSYQEGWRTDRGIVYIVFDRPDYVYRSENREEWLYGEPDHRNSLRFDFVRVRNPFTNDDYMLMRSPSMKDPWYITVQSWRR